MHMKSLRTWITALLMTASTGLPITAQQDSIDYVRVFGDSWAKAEKLVGENERWMRNAIARYGFRFEEAMAVVFPELVRYSAMQDMVEVSLLKALYVNLGTHYANFSVGPFQMKPSFAEKIRSELPVLSDRHATRLLEERPKEYSDREYRAMIVKDLETKETMVRYLIAFLCICRERYSLPQGEDGVRFLSTAYNYDFLAGQSESEKMINERYFAIGIMSQEKWSYAEVAVFWYNKYLSSQNSH